MDISNVLLFTLYEKEIPHQYGFEYSFYFRFFAYSQLFYPLIDIFIFILFILYYGDLFCRIEFSFQAEG